MMMIHSLRGTFTKYVNAFKMIIINFLEGAQNMTNIWFALCEYCNLKNRDVGRGLSLHILGFVCVFAIVFARNVAMVKVRPLPISEVSFVPIDISIDGS